MLGTWKRLTLPLLALLLMLGLSACDANDPTVDAEDVGSQMLHLRGVLNTDFEQEKAEFIGAVNAVEAASRLDIRLLAREQDRDTQEQVNLVVSLPLAAGARMLPPGDYIFTAEDLQQARVDYNRSNEATQNFAQYQFEGVRFSLRVEQADLDGMLGQFSLQARQIQGQRMQDGQLEDVHLANAGEIQVQSRFEITDISVH